MVLGIYGASGLGTEFHGLANAINMNKPTWDTIVYVDDDESKAGTILREKEVMTYKQAIDRFGKDGIEFILAIGEPVVKDKVFARLEDAGCKITCLIHPDYLPFMTPDM